MASVKSQGGGLGLSNLSKQNLSTLNVAELTPLSPEVISRQATINIGTIGHVAHGKSTVVKAVSGVQTVRFKNELERNITIKLDSSNNEERDKNRIPKKRQRGGLSDGTIEKNMKKNRVRSPEISPNTEEYEVEAIRSHSMINGKVNSYFVKWKGWREEDNTWEPFQNLRGCLETVVVYFEEVCYGSRTDLTNRPVHLPTVTSRFFALKKHLSTFSTEELEDTARYYFTNGGHDLPDISEESNDELIMVLSRIPPSAHDCKFVKEIRNNLLYLTLREKRKDQLRELSMWEEEINSVHTGSMIKVVNSVDLEGPPKDFIYINHSYPGLGVTINKDPLIGCDCKKVCLHKKCYSLHGCGRSYKNGLVAVPQGVAIYECNSLCSCDQDCENRVVQKGNKVPLCIFRTSNGCGWGVKALSFIPKGSFICEYIGEIITNEEAERRGRYYDREGCTYLFDLDFTLEKFNSYTIDAKNYGNISHFINHSCSPNVSVYAVWIDCLDPYMPQLALFANKNIQEGCELSIDYLCQTKDEKRSHGDVLMKAVCKCGSHMCRKFLF